MVVGDTRAQAVRKIFGSREGLQASSPATHVTGACSQTLPVCLGQGDPGMMREHAYELACICARARIATVDALHCRTRAVAAGIAHARACDSRGQNSMGPQASPCLFYHLLVHGLTPSLCLLSQSLPCLFMEGRGRPEREKGRRERERERERERARKQKQSTGGLAAACITEAVLSTKPCSVPARAPSPPCTHGADPRAMRRMVE